jgi:hypothetical protein
MPQSIDDDEYDIEKETASNRKMLEERIPAQLNDIYRVLVQNRQGFEPWRLFGPTMIQPFGNVFPIEHFLRQLDDIHGTGARHYRRRPIPFMRAYLTENSTFYICPSI